MKLLGFVILSAGLFAQSTQPVSAVDSSTNPPALANFGDASNRAVRVNVVAGGGAGGTASTFGIAFPGTGTAAGFIDFNGNMAGANLDASGNLKINCLIGCAGGGGGGGTSSSFGALFPSTGTAAGAKDQSGNMSAMLLDGSGRLIVNGSAVTQPVSGTVTALQGGAPWSVSQSGSWTIATLTGITNPLPAGTNVIGHVIADSGSTTAVTGSVTISGTVTANAGSNLNTSALALESGGNLATLAGAVSGGVVQTNVSQINGGAPDMNAGNASAATQRVVLASNQPTVTTSDIANVTQGTTTAPSTVTVVAGRTSDTAPQYRALPLTSNGNSVAVSTYGGPPLPLPKCNPVRRYYCQ